MKIYAPVKDVNGTYASVLFVNGVGETDNPSLIEWFRERGYLLGEDASPSVDNPALDNMTVAEIREWAKNNGFGGVIKNNKSKEKLIELIRG